MVFEISFTVKKLLFAVTAQFGKEEISLYIGTQKVG